MVGLWEPDFRAETPAADCEGWRLDTQGFCTADDSRNGVELGVKFQTSRDLLITGIRVYRVDLATITGSLWPPRSPWRPAGSRRPIRGTGRT